MSLQEGRKSAIVVVAFDVQGDGDEVHEKKGADRPPYVHEELDIQLGHKNRKQTKKKVNHVEEVLAFLFMFILKKKTIFVSFTQVSAGRPISGTCPAAPPRSGGRW